MIQGVAQASGWDPATIVTALLAATAAVAGFMAIVMNRVMQRDQQQWQESQGERHRSWEAQQEQERRRWQEAQTVETRWDDYKRRLYGAFVSGADRLYAVSGDLAGVHRDLSEDLVNHMSMVEDHHNETEGGRIKAMTEEQRREFWKEKYEGQLAWFKERRKSLSEAESEVRVSLAATVGELHLIVPDHLREQIDGLAHFSQQSYYGSSHTQRREREAMRNELINAVRTDLRVTSDQSEVGP